MNAAALDKYQRTPLHLATNRSRVGQMLLARDDVNPEARDKDQLHWAAKIDNVKLAVVLLDRDDVNPNACDEKLLTPLRCSR